MFRVGVAIMRLQPFHNGHKRIIDTMFSRSDIVIVLIGSINKVTAENFLSFQDRKLIISSLYSDKAREQGKRLHILGIEDIASDVVWARYVERLIRLYVGNDTNHITYYFGDYKDAKLFISNNTVMIIDRKELALSSTYLRRLYSICVNITPEMNTYDSYKSYMPEISFDVFDNALRSAKRN